MSKFLTLNNGDIVLQELPTPTPYISHTWNQFQTITTTYKPYVRYDSANTNNWNTSNLENKTLEGYFCIVLDVKDSNSYDVNGIINHSNAINENFSFHSQYTTKSLSGSTTVISKPFLIKFNSIITNRTYIQFNYIKKNNITVTSINKDTELDFYVKVIYRESSIII